MKWQYLYFYGILSIFHLATSFIQNGIRKYIFLPNYDIWYDQVYNLLRERENTLKFAKQNDKWVWGIKFDCQVITKHWIVFFYQETNESFFNNDIIIFKISFEK